MGPSLQTVAREVETGSNPVSVMETVFNKHPVEGILSIRGEFQFPEEIPVSGEVEFRD
jgi:hypothetical protein